MQFKSVLHALMWLKDSRYLTERLGSPFSPHFHDVQMRPNGTPSINSFEDAVHVRRDLLRLMRRLPKERRYVLAAYCFRAGLIRQHAVEIVIAHQSCSLLHGYKLIRFSLADYERVLVEHGYVRDLSGLGDAPR